MVRHCVRTATEESSDCNIGCTLIIFNTWCSFHGAPKQMGFIWVYVALTCLRSARSAFFCTAVFVLKGNLGGT